MQGRTGKRLVAALFVISALGLPTHAAGQDDPRRERQKVRQQAADVAAQVDALQGDAAEVQRALRSLQANVAGQEAATADARRLADQAAHDLEVARAEEAAVQAQVDSLKASMQEAGVQAYVRGDRAGELELDFSFDAAQPLRALARTTLAQATANSWQDAVEALRDAQEDLAAKRAAAEDATIRANEARAAAESQLSELRVARDQQASYAATVDARLDQKLSEAASLQALDSNLAARIAADEARIAAAAPRGGGGGGGRSAPFSAGNVSVTTVRGITVATSIAGQLEQLLAAAAADGITLSGSGYRSSSSQVALRQQNCPDPVNSSPGSCRPPTARAGASMHERGLAVDFAYGGRAINSRSSPAFQWLAANAGAYGFVNLPSEPWHWSTTGQ